MTGRRDRRRTARRLLLLFLLLCRSRRDAVNACARMASLLQTRGLFLHPEKTRILSFDDGFTFLGHRFEGHRVRCLTKTAAPAPLRLEGRWI